MARETLSLESRYCSVPTGSSAGGYSDFFTPTQSHPIGERVIVEADVAYSASGNFRCSSNGDKCGAGIRVATWSGTGVQISDQVKSVVTFGPGASGSTHLTLVTTV